MNAVSSASTNSSYARRCRALAIISGDRSTPVRRRASPEAPYGFLRRVTDVREVAGEIVIDTVPASLLDAVTRGSLDETLVLTPDDIADVVSAWTGIPAGRLLEGETAKLLRMEDELGRRVIGQRAAIASVSSDEGATARHTSNGTG